MLAVGYRLPKVIAVTMPPPGADGEAQKKAKFEKDFVIISEFSEQVGPIPIVSGQGYYIQCCRRSWAVCKALNY